MYTIDFDAGSFAELTGIQMDEEWTTQEVIDLICDYSAKLDTCPAAAVIQNFVLCLSARQ